MRIGCLQFAPQVGDVDDNINRADAVLSKANPENLDLLVLPELAFAGYNFKSLQEISPFLELQASGISALWARTVALKLNCVVTIGYPEKEDVESKWPSSPEYYNSVIAVNADGEAIAHYRKNFLYYTDETWALEGPDGFYGDYIPELGTTAMGICMDINPYKFEAPWHAFEFAFHCLEVEANLVIITMAWLTREDSSLFSHVPHEPDMDTLTYWMARLEPLIRSENQEEIIVVFCNRTGIERGVVYAGTSTVIGVKDGEVNVYGLLGRGEEELLVVDTDKPPSAKLVYCPDGQGSTMVSAYEFSSGSEEVRRMDSDQTAVAKPSSTQPSSKASPKTTTEINATQDQAPFEEARLISPPYSPVSQKSHSNYQSRSNKKSNSSHQLRSSQKSHGRREVAPLGFTRGESDGKVMSPIQKPSVPIETDTLPTSTQPSPTLTHIPKSRLLAGNEHQTARVCSRHVSTHRQNEVITPTASDGVTTESSDVFLWPPFDALLKTAIEPRPWTPARADSPTLSMGIAAISQVQAKTTPVKVG
ncbi:hypothetical protein EKO27_g2725 [Xylaria grammica]|uniref:CN hydrolase domain-containing protein n=1 Tax=Xylaria grammica TaxID=363999 RepID=A0A439DDE4_9PEZI|nr:hypothetical protein EKO27_g2725 [Xylaria grammica]